ncbi:MAG: MFS transporter [Clostridia bacterium]|nr:MFS transporter [Clostridia bacterium]
MNTTIHTEKASTKDAKKRRAMPGRLIFLCWLVYAVSYIAKLSYSANIREIGDAFMRSDADCGLVSTMFFFAYGIGQIVNGILCKKYNIKYVILGALAVSGAMNIAVGLTSNFDIIKYLWLVNGAALSFLWTSLIRLLSETIDKANISRAIVIMGTTVASGTLVVYGISSLIAAVASYRIVFYIAAASVFAVAVAWLIAYEPFVRPLYRERSEELTLDDKDLRIASSFDKTLLPLLSVLALFAVANNFVKDGLTTWTPDILGAIYDTPSWLSILLTLLLPMLAIFGIFVAVSLRKLLRNFVAICTVLYSLSLLLIGIVILTIARDVMPVTITSFALVSCLMAGINNVITSMVPLYLKDRASSGMLAGILNGFCYLGSTVSAYSLGAIADNSSWSSVLWVIGGVCAAMVIIGIVVVTVTLAKNKGKSSFGTGKDA